MKPARFQNRPAQIRLPWVAAGGGLGIALALIALFWSLRDPLPELSYQALAAARERWEQGGIGSYDLDLKVGGTRPGTVHVEVRQGTVTAMTRDGITPRQKHSWDYWSVLGQFDMMERELELAENPQREMNAGQGTSLLLKAEFHPQLGYPLRYRRIVLGQGSEVSWETLRFHPTP